MISPLKPGKGNSVRNPLFSVFLRPRFSRETITLKTRTD